MTDFPNDPFVDPDCSEAMNQGVETVGALVALDTDLEAVKAIVALSDEQRAAALYAAMMMLRVATGH